jgi:hypothetical protein
VRRIVSVTALALGALAAPRGGRAQSASDLVSLGVRAYQNLDYDAAAAELRRGLQRAAGDTLPPRDRLAALTYLAATEQFRGHRDSAMAAFRRLVWLDPSYRPNELVFPPEVTGLFAEVRATTKAVTVAVAATTELHLGVGRLTARLRASAPHDLTVAITRVDGTLVRMVYAGPIADSLEVTWDGRTAMAAVPEDGHYVLRATSAASPDRGVHAVLVPLEISRVTLDSASPPSVAAPTPVAVARGRSLVAGALVAVAAVALPGILARGGHPWSGRYAVAAASGAAGIAGFLGWRPGGGAAAVPPLPGIGPKRPAVAAVTLLIRAGPATVFPAEQP